MNNQVFILSNGVRDIYLDLLDMYWYYYESSIFNIDKEICFLKLLLDMASLRMRRFMHINRDAVGTPHIISDIGEHSAKLICLFIKIKALSKDIFCTGDIATDDYCMEVCRQFLKGEPFDFFIESIWEIREAFQKMERQLQIFLENLRKLFRIFCGLLPKKSKLRDNLNETEKNI